VASFALPPAGEPNVIPAIEQVDATKNVRRDEPRVRLEDRDRPCSAGGLDLSDGPSVGSRRSDRRGNMVTAPIV
jgi:hypothetical protein